MPKVLVAGGDSIIKTSLINVLTSQKHEVTSVTTAQEALTKLEQAKFDVFFCDPAVCGQRSDEFFYNVSKGFSGVPIVAMIDSPDVDYAVSLLTDGAAECVAPPFNEEELSSVVKKVMGQIGYYHLKGESIVPPKKSVTWLFAAAISALSVIAAGYAAYHYRIKSRAGSYSREGVSTFLIPLAHSTGLAFGKGSLWISDWYEQKIYKYSTDNGFALTSEYYFPDYYPTSVAAAEDFLWSTGNDKTVRKHAYDPHLTILATYNTPGGSLTGLSWDGRNLWACDTDAKKVYRILPKDRLIVEESFSYSGIEPIGFIVEGATTWSADAASNQLLKLEVKDNAVSVSQRFTLKPFQVAGNRFGGVASDGKHIWVISENTGIVYREEWKNLK